MKRIFWLMLVVLMLIASFAFGADAPPERAAAVEMLKSFFLNSWPALLGWAISEVMPFLPGKASGIAHLVKIWAESKGQSGRSKVGILFYICACSLLALSIMACTPLITSTIQMGCSQDELKQTNKADTDQKPTTSTSAAVPVSVGAQPNSNGTVNK